MSNRKCCVPGCANSLDAAANLHKFPNPNKDRQLFNTWVFSIGGDILQLENKHIFKYRRICHVHFEPKHWCRNNRLAKGAVPTKNMPGLSCSKFSIEKRALRPLQMSEPSTSKSIFYLSYAYK
ncbi:uncharacterized protein LOC123705355 [Colias croceus]|uniref:uncharacterized protein LOC123705355 n=1 Tax=Colias crocea TaxID=72248 RepID=UPI001E27BECD|nr:uncharacterized protein LOC123705355 [Colias croceus]